jgi:hypothetical protein
MTGVVLDTTFPDDGEPYYSADQNLKDDIAAITNLVAWFQADPAEVTFATGTDIGTVTDVAGLTGTLTPTSTVRRPALADDQINGLEAFDFTRADSDSFQLGVASLDTNADFSYAALFRPTDAGLTVQTIVGRQTDSSNRAVMWIISADKLRFTYGADLTGEANLTDGEWYLAICSLNESEGKLKLRVNGVNQTEDVSITANAGGTATVCVGAVNTAGGSPFGGEITDVWLFQKDILATANAADLALVEQYVQNVYGLSF